MHYPLADFDGIPPGDPEDETAARKAIREHELKRWRRSVRSLILPSILVAAAVILILGIFWIYGRLTATRPIGAQALGMAPMVANALRAGVDYGTLRIAFLLVLLAASAAVVVVLMQLYGLLLGLGLKPLLFARDPYRALFWRLWSAQEQGLTSAQRRPLAMVLLTAIVLTAIRLATYRVPALISRGGWLSMMAFVVAASAVAVAVVVSWPTVHRFYKPGKTFTPSTYPATMRLIMYHTMWWVLVPLWLYLFIGPGIALAAGAGEAINHQFLQEPCASTLSNLGLDVAWAQAQDEVPRQTTAALTRLFAQRLAPVACTWFPAGLLDDPNVVLLGLSQAVIATFLVALLVWLLLPYLILIGRKRGLYLVVALGAAFVP